MPRPKKLLRVSQNGIPRETSFTPKKQYPSRGSKGHGHLDMVREEWVDDDDGSGGGSGSGGGWDGCLILLAVSLSAFLTVVATISQLCGY